MPEFTLNVCLHRSLIKMSPKRRRFETRGNFNHAVTNSISVSCIKYTKYLINWGYTARSIKTDISVNFLQSAIKLWLSVSIRHWLQSSSSTPIRSFPSWFCLFSSRVATHGNSRAYHVPRKDVIDYTRRSRWDITRSVNIPCNKDALGRSDVHARCGAMQSHAAPCVLVKVMTWEKNRG